MSTPFSNLLWSFDQSLSLSYTRSVRSTFETRERHDSEERVRCFPIAVLKVGRDSWESGTQVPSFRFQGYKPVMTD